MKKIKSKYLKALAILLSVTMLMTGLPAPIYAESVATPTDTVEVLETEEVPVEENAEQPAETPSEEPEQVEEPPVETPAEDEPVTELDEPEIPEQTEQSDIPSEETPDESIHEEIPTDDSCPAEEPADAPEEAVEAQPVVEDEPVIEDESEQEIPVEPLPEDEILIEDDPSEPIPEDETIEEVITEENPLKAAIDAHGYTYLMTASSIQAFSDADMWEHCFTIEPNGILLVTAFIEQDGLNILEVQFLTPSGELILAYVHADDMPDTLLTGADIDAAALTTDFALVFVGDGKVAVFAVDGMAPGAVVEEQPVVDIPVEPEQSEELLPVEIPVQPDLPANQPMEEPAVNETPTEDEQPEEVPVETEQPEETPSDPTVIEDIPPEDAQATDSPFERPSEEQPATEATPFDAGDFVLVTTDTRVFLGVDDSAADDYEGDLSLGVFVNDATVQIEAVEQDSLGRTWYKVCFMYGDTYADGTLKWTEYDSIYVLAAETFVTDAQDFSVTDYAFETPPRAMSTFALRSTTPMYGFSLRDISMSLGNFYVGQSGLYGDSGKDSEYLQIATLAGYGKIYATPHYLEGYTVYCLEHLLPGPGERISGGGYQPRGPYVIVDIDSYMNTPGYSSVMYKESTMHAIAWVLRHTVPFMELDRYDADNRTWSRVAGQFAIREVIKQLEGSRYVRDYWQMDDFYAASGNAPAVYLEYARWLAENGIARASMTGSISVSNESVYTANGMTVGTVTLTTDADLIRISKAYGTVTGHTYGEDGSYYYLNSGDTITITSASSAFSFRAESMSSPDEEANFFVGVSEEAIQKVLIPQTGLPYILNAVSVSFDIPYGSVSVTKTDAATGAVLAGATFDLISGSTVIQSMTTGADGVVTFTNVPPGTYTIRERSAPEGYTLGSVNVQTVTVSNGQTSCVTFANNKITAQIRIRKTDQLTGAFLSGASFTITRLSAPATDNGAGVGESFTITTDANGIAETGWLKWGRYRVEETRVPDGFINNHYATEIEAYENGRTYTIDVQNEPMTGFIQLEKTDSMDGQPIAGVQFDIYHNDQFGSDLAGTMTTNQNGVAISPPLRKGDYLVVEHENPTGYVYNLVELTATVLSDETTYLTAENQPIEGKIRIIKKDQLTGDLLAGAEFTITRISGLPSHNDIGNGEVVAIITTDANGVAESPLLTYGTYQVSETVVPEHFVDNSFSTEVTISEDNLKTYEIVVENEPAKGWLRLTKTNSLDGHPIAGVTFNIYYADEYGTGLAGTMTTDANGVALSPALRKGRYLVQEADEAIGYVSDLVELHAVVNPDETTYLSATNQPIQGTLRIIKQDELTGEALAGAEFTITRVSGLPSHNGAGDNEIVTVITTDANGVAVSPLLTYGTYKVEETKVPLHFVDNDFSTEMVINEENFCTYEITVENEPAKGWIRLTKTDRVNGNAIAGVVFDVYYADQYGQGLATTMVTDENGVAVSEPLRKGRYTVQERGATAGYVFEEILLDATVHSDETTELAVTNQPVLVKLKLYKRDADEYTGNPADTPAVRGDGDLTGAEFQVLAAEDITDRQGNVVHAKGDVVVASIKTAGADASVTTDALWPGLYEIVELTPPTGYQPATGSIIVDARDAAQQSEEAIVTYEGVITNEITYGAQAIVKILGTGTVEADPTRVETPEPNAEFRVYLQKAGSYDNAREIERDYLITDENGYAMTKALPYGVYVLEQVKGKEGYEIKGPITFEIDGTESLVNPPPLTLSDQPILYRLKFIKTDSETGKVITLSNTTFRLKDANGEYVKQTVFYPREQEIDTFTTDNTGSVTLPETVTWGLYFIEEVKAPEGYLIRSEDFSVFVGNEGDQPGQTYELEIEIPNDPVKGRILLDKKGLQLTGFTISTDAWGNEVHTPVYEEGYLAGAVFEIRAAETITGNDGTVWYQAGDLVDTITTTANGGDASGELPLGKYNVIEVSAPEGYFFDDRAIAVDLHYQDDQTALVEVHAAVENDFLPAEITLWKEKEEIHVVSSGKDGVKSVLTDEPGEGFVFGLYTTRDIPYAYGTLMADTLVASGATDSNGMLTLNGTFPHGDYYIRELSAPAGWRMTADRIDLSITPDRKADDEPVLRVLLVDAIHNELIHTKVTLTKTDITGEKTLPGATIEVYDEGGRVIYRDTTDANGRIANIPVKPGRYTFREIYAPDGYALNEAVMSFSVDADGVVTGDTTIRDDYTRFSIEKYDENEKPLSGVEFSLVVANGSTVMTVKTDMYGVAAFEKVPFGSYRIVESKPLAGYLSAEMDVEITVDGTFINPEEPLAIIVNIPNEVLIQKVDQDGKPLAGAEFALIDAFGERFAVAASDENGMVRFTKVPYGSYTIRELKAPGGYLTSKEEIAVTIDADYRSTGKPLATVVNHLKRVQFIKVDTSGKYLPGVEFSLINAVTHEVVETAVSNEKGEFIFTKFDYGDWIIRETAAPEGYNHMEDYLLHVDESWAEPEPITLVNIPSTYMFFKSDNKKNALAGATFAVEDETGNVVQEVVSAENGVVTIYGLMPGKYIIRETATVEGFTVNDDTIEVVIDEEYTVPAKLKRFVNYPSISTGVDITPTTLTWIGVGLAGIAGIIVIVGMKKNSTPRHARKRK